MQDLALYIHYPFCVLKCPYCDFNSHVRDKVDISSYVQGYKNELAFYASNLGSRTVKTIFFGGGTPSLMPYELVSEILSSVSKNFSLSRNVEISLEANPSSVENKNLSYFKKAGINRLSLGIQSLDDQDLKFLGRAHNSSEARDAILIAKDLFANFSLDFIYTLPQQKIDQWLEALETIFTFNSKHLSLYQLTIEKGTRFYSQHQRQEFTMPSNDESATFYTETSKACLANGYERYEVSNYAQSGYESIHNLTYWEYGEYLGIGAGAHSRVSYDGSKMIKALMNIHSPEKWLEGVLGKGSALQSVEVLDRSIMNEEKIMLGLRKSSGISLNDVKVNEGKLAIIENEGLIVREGDAIKATDRGVLLLNSLVSELSLI